MPVKPHSTGFAGFFISEDILRTSGFPAYLDGRE